MALFSTTACKKNKDNTNNITTSQTFAAGGSTYTVASVTRSFSASSNVLKATSGDNAQISFLFSGNNSGPAAGTVASGSRTPTR
jgi:hypothetical protein